MIKFNNSKQIIFNKQHSLGSHKEQPLLFSSVHLILCSMQEWESACTLRLWCATVESESREIQRKGHANGENQAKHQCQWQR